MLAGLLFGCSRQQPVKQSTEPFSVQDVSTVLSNRKTVSDYIAAIKPDKYSWAYLGNEAGQTQLTMECKEGNLIVCVLTKDGTIDGDSDGEASALPEEVKALTATVTGIEWTGKSFGIPTLRGVNIGDDKQKVLAGYLKKGSDTAMYTIKDLNAEADASWIADWAFVGGRFIPKGDFYDYDTLEYGWCELKDAKAYKLYYSLSYQLEGDKVHGITLYIEGDETDTGAGADTP